MARSALSTRMTLALILYAFSLPDETNRRFDREIRRHMTNDRPVRPERRRRNVAISLGIGLLSGGYGREELERSGAYRVYADPAEMLTRLEEVGVRPIR